jgi:hypothetical protein
MSSTQSQALQHFICNRGLLFHLGGAIKSPLDIYNAANCISFVFQLYLHRDHEGCKEVSVDLPSLYSYWEAADVCLINGKFFSNLSNKLSKVVSENDIGLIGLKSLAFC